MFCNLNVEVSYTHNLHDDSFAMLARQRDYK